MFCSSLDNPATCYPVTYDKDMWAICNMHIISLRHILRSQVSNPKWYFSNIDANPPTLETRPKRSNIVLIIQQSDNNKKFKNQIKISIQIISYGFIFRSKIRYTGGLDGFSVFLT